MNSLPPKRAGSFPLWIAVFVGLPIVELYLLLRIAAVMGPLPTLALVLVTGVLGAALARQQGFQVLDTLKRDLSSGRVPTEALMDGVLVLIGGIVLLTPGILTDLTGLALLLPPTRSLVKTQLRRKWQHMQEKPPQPPPCDSGHSEGGGPVIDV